MRDVMIDLETFSIRPDAMIVAIGAVEFNQRGLGREFYHVIDPRWAFGHMDPSTVAWWMNQSDEARAIFAKTESVSIGTALDNLVLAFDFFDPDVRVWGHGSSFDIPIIESAFRACGDVNPWGHRAARDTRTILELADVKIVMPESAKHNALEDAKAQAEAVIRAAEVLGSWRLWPTTLHRDPPEAPQ